MKLSCVRAYPNPGLRMTQPTPPLKTHTHTHTLQMDGVGGREGGPLARCMQSQI